MPVTMNCSQQRAQLSPVRYLCTWTWPSRVRPRQHLKSNISLVSWRSSTKQERFRLKWTVRHCWDWWPPTGLIHKFGSFTTCTCANIRPSIIRTATHTDFKNNSSTLKKKKESTLTFAWFDCASTLNGMPGLKIPFYLSVHFSGKRFKYIYWEHIEPNGQ